MRIKKIRKKEPFWKARNLFGFKYPGIGISTSYLNNYNIIEVNISTSKKNWFISTDKIKEFLLTNNTYYKIKGKEVVVIPWNLFQSEISLTNQVIPTFKKQNKLF